MADTRIATDRGGVAMFAYDRTFQIAAPPRVAYEVAADHGSYGAYGMKYLVNVRVISPEDPDGYTESEWYWKGMGVQVKYVLRAHHDAQHLRIRYDSQPNPYVRRSAGDWSFVADGDGTKMVAHFEAEIGPGGWIANMLEPLFRAGWNDMARALARESERRAGRNESSAPFNEPHAGRE